MKILNYIKRLFNNQLIMRTLTVVQNVIGDIYEYCKSIGVTVLSELQTRLRGVAYLLLCTSSNSEPSDLSHGSQSSLNHIDPLIPRGKQMNKFITMLLGLVLFLTMTYGFTTVFHSLGLAPILGITLRGRHRSNNTKTLPKAYNGVRDSDMNKIDYIRSRVDQVNESKLLVDQVSRVTKQAEEQWSKDHPDFERIQRHIIDNDYCGLVEVYKRSGLDFPSAFDNTLIAIVRKYGNLITNDLYSVDYTIGEFIAYVEEEHCLDCYNSINGGELLDSVYKLQNDYGVKFNQPVVTTPSSDEDDDIIQIDDDDLIMLDDIDDDDDDIELIEFHKSSLKPMGGIIQKVATTEENSYLRTLHNKISNKTVSEMLSDEITKSVNSVDDDQDYDDGLGSIFG